ncbi:A/G-specific adenine glycosylase [Sphingosinicella microcystinivorans]|uniref:A/G-specific adenine glycosylase n=1 Tax=Sphingosinicella microcystinivorans TaxID=335406 RepID=UPI0022F3B0B2|nr:A/G-specific adenine glycosylase [Sphingosinicella microcystinivorans]WBX83626.1 A/G-specific adenine glycosylase [Sphingosinicella microcystinivorans]
MPAKEIAPKDIAAPLLAWYDRSHRRLPWRAPPGANAADPYRVWLSEIMLQQTTVAAVIPYFEAFTTRWPTVEALAAAGDGDVLAAWAGLGYYARARNLLACARAVASDHGGRFPASEAALLGLPGVGAYTAAAIAAIAFGARAVVVDGNVERVVARLFAVEDRLPAAKPRLRTLADTITPEARAGDFAQAMMDLGATICRPKSPDCLVCPVIDACDAARRGIADLLPKKAPKPARPVRYANVYVLRDGGEIMLVRRPPRGLLGGMLGLPMSEIADTPHPEGTHPGAPAAARWSRGARPVSHVFTHFELHLTVFWGDLSDITKPAGDWRAADESAARDLPTLFRKALDFTASVGQF